jgi:hypothetical protein
MTYTEAYLIVIADAVSTFAGGLIFASLILTFISGGLGFFENNSTAKKLFWFLFLPLLCFSIVAKTLLPTTEQLLIIYGLTLASC